MLEKTFEDILAKYPELIEEDLTLVGRQSAVYGRQLDLLFEDRFRIKLLVELKVGPIKDAHIGQIMAYLGSLLSGDDPHIRMMLIGNRVPPNIGKALDHVGIAWKEITIQQLKKYLVEKQDNELLSMLKNEESLAAAKPSGTAPAPARSEKGSEKGHPNTFTVVSKYRSRTFHGVQLTVKCWVELLRETREYPAILANRKDIDVFTTWVSKHKDLEVANYFQEFGVAEPYTKMFECLKEDMTGIGNSLSTDHGRPATFAIRDDILNLLKQPEGPNLEFKQTFLTDIKTGVESPAVLMSGLKTIAAFLNTKGGTLLVGISDSRTICGMETDFRFTKKNNADTFEQKLRDLLMSRFNPVPLEKVDIAMAEFAEGVVCHVSVKPAHRPDVFHLDDEVYVREGNTTRHLRGPELTQWLKERMKS